MTAPLHNPTRLSGIPASQNTAPVAEFRCLFTPDVRRKQKRWQDGFLKFHAFNSRVMVYDASRNFLGDTYWKDSNSIQEGDELTLDKGTLVEVAEAMGVSQTDLTPLFAKKSPHGKPPVAAKLPVPLANTLRAGSQMKHKSLNTLLGTPKGPIGKSVPIRSPFEARKEQESEWAGDRAAKRQRTGPSRPPVASSSPTRGVTLAPESSLPALAKVAEPKKAFRAPRPVPQGAAVITIDSTPDYTFSDISLPSSIAAPDRAAQARRPLPKAPVLPPTDLVPRAAQRPPVSAPPPKETPQKVPKRGLLPRPKPIETPRQPARTSSPPVSVSNRISNVGFARQAEKEQSPPASPPRDPRAKSLRPATGVKRRTLLCQTSKSPPRARTLVKLPRDVVLETIKAKESQSRANNAGNPLDCESSLKALDDEILNQAAEKPTDAMKKRKTPPTTRADATSKKPRAKEKPPLRLPSSSPAFEDMDVIYGLMDQRMMPKQSPPKRQQLVQPKSPPAPRVPIPKPAPAKEATEKQRPLRSPLPPIAASPEPTKKKPAAKSKVASKPCKKTRDPTPPTPITIHDSPPALRQRPELQSREVSAAPSRTSMSMSPTKLFSTGGFRKRTKAGKSKTPVLRAPASPPKHTTGNPRTGVRLPDAPDLPSRTNDNVIGNGNGVNERDHTNVDDGLTMPVIDDLGNHISTTTKRSTKPARRAKPGDDPPIPSTSEQWERRNLSRSNSLVVNKAVTTSTTDTADPTTTPTRANNVDDDSREETTTTTSAVAIAVAAVTAPTVPVPVIHAAKPANRKPSPLASLILKTDPRRTRSLNTDAGVNLGRGLSISSVDAIARRCSDPEPQSPPEDRDMGPWSTEAFDLMGWRPPEQNEEGQGA